MLAYERVLARHGIGHASLSRVAAELGVAPGLIHHHFDDREDLVVELVRTLARRFRSALPDRSDPADFVEAYVDAALSVRGPARPTTAKAWVGILAEALRNARIAGLVRQAMAAEIDRLRDSFVECGLARAEAEREAAGVVSAILGALVLGALLPGRAKGFAAPIVRASVRRAVERGRLSQRRS